MQSTEMVRRGIGNPPTLAVGRLLVDRFFYTETHTLTEIVAYAGWVAATRWRRFATELQLAVQLR